MARHAERRPRVRRADYAPPPWLVDAVRLEIDLDADRTRVAARLEVRRNGKHGAPLRLDGSGVKLLSLKVDGRAASHKLDPKGLTVRVARECAVVETLVEIAPRAAASQTGVFEVNSLLATHCEPEGFRRITFFPDRPDVLSRFTVRLTADRARYPVLLAGGNPVAAGEGEGGRHWAEWHDPWPRPCYLFALLAGDLAARRGRFTTRSGREVALAVWARPDRLAETAEALAALKAVMAWDEATYGLEYDLDALHVAAIPGFGPQAMENKGLLLFDETILVHPETATDQEREVAAMLVAHEYLHNWTGDRVTIRDWFELGWKEGLTVFRDQGFTASRGSAAARRVEDVRVVRAAAPARIRRDSYEDPRTVFEAATYTRAAEVVRRIEGMVGAGGFRRRLRAFLGRFEGRAVTWDDFLEDMVPAGERPALAQLLGSADALDLLGRSERPVARWDSMQALMTSAVFDEAWVDPVVDAAEVELVPEEEPAFLARLLDLPHESEIARRRLPLDPQPIVLGLRRLRRALGAGLADQWQSILASPPSDAGGRALRNLALDYLASAEVRGAGAVALRRLEEGPTMTDRYGALQALAHSDLPERVQGFAAFHARWRAHPQVLDRWFAAQAGSRRATALEEVRRLLGHPDFTPSRPQRVWAVFGALGANFAALHHPSGLGYRLLADAALAFAGAAPDLAARIAAPLLQAPPLEPRRAALLAAQVQRLPFGTGAAAAG